MQSRSPSSTCGLARLAHIEICMSSRSGSISRNRDAGDQSSTVPIRYRTLGDEADAWAAEYLAARIGSAGDGSESCHAVR